MGGHLGGTLEVGSYKVAGCTPKSVNPLFSLQAGGAKKKGRKKETPLGGVSRVSTRDRRFAAGSRKTFKKVLSKFSPMDLCKHIR